MLASKYILIPSVTHSKGILKEKLCYSQNYIGHDV